MLGSASCCTRATQLCPTLPRHKQKAVRVTHDEAVRVTHDEMLRLAARQMLQRNQPEEQERRRAHLQSWSQTRLSHPTFGDREGVRLLLPPRRCSQRDGIACNPDRCP